MEEGVEESERLTSPLNLIRQREKEEENDNYAGDQGAKTEEEEKMGDEEEKREEIIKVTEEDGEKRANEGRSNDEHGDGILNSLVSNLPPVTVLPSPPIPEDASPATDEASILISIIHD